MKENSTKPCCCAETNVSYNEDYSGLEIKASLPGVEKKDISFSINSAKFCIIGQREDLKYNCCYQLSEEIDPDESYAEYNDGLLTVKAPFKFPLNGKNLKIH